MPRFVRFALLSTAAAGLVACSSNPTSPSVATDATNTKSHGATAASLTCDTFPVADTEAAVQQVVPGAKVERIKPTAEPALSNVSCRFNVFMPGTDLTAGRGLVTMSVRISDVWKMADPDPSRQRKHYDDFHATQTAQADREHTYTDVSGVGAAAFVEDFAPGSADRPTMFSTELRVLRDQGPYKVESSLEYLVPKHGEGPADKTLDTAVRDKTNRAKIIENVVKSVLSKIA